MIIILSPAKTFNKVTETSGQTVSLINKANTLIDILKSKSMHELKELLKVSEALANKAFHYYQNINHNTMAISLYGGQAFKYLNYSELSHSDLENLYVISPLYGLVNALDAISPYRLDIKDKLIDESLYTYWYADINDKLASLNDDLIINLASGEFHRLLDSDFTNIYTINFGILKDGKVSGNSMELKKMRGLMANYLLKNKIDNLDDLKKINLEGYTYNSSHSKNQLLMFTKEAI